MKKLILLVFVMFFSLPGIASDDSKEKPTQHLQVEDIVTMKNAKEIFLGKTLEMMEKKNIGLQEASEIHIITYALEKSVAYFAENLEGEKQLLAKEMAVVVEDIHLTSENNRLGELQAHIQKYFNLVDEFLFCF